MSGNVTALPIPVTPNNLPSAQLPVQPADVVVVTRGAVSGQAAVAELVLGGFPINLTATWSGIGAYPGLVIGTGNLSITAEWTLQHPSPQGAWQPLVLTMAIPSSATITEADAEFIYITNASTATAGVAYGASVRSAANNTQSWGSAVIVNDDGFTGSQIIGVEYDLGSENINTTGTLGTAAYGISILAGFPNGTPASSAGLSISTVGSPQVPWNWGILIWEGCSVNGISLQALTSANSESSQPIGMSATDASGASHSASMQVVTNTSTGDFQIGTTNGNINLNVSGATGKIAVDVPFQIHAGTVAQLPTPAAWNIDSLAVVTDATAPAFGAAVAGGGGVRALVFCDGVYWLPVVTGAAQPFIFSQNVQPSSDNTRSLGISGTRWSAVWAANGTIQTSDPSLKTDIAKLPSVLNLVASLDPITFKWKDGGSTQAMQEIERDVPVTETYEELEETIEMVNGVATLVTKTVTKERPVYDTVPLFNPDGTRAMHTNPAMPELRNKKGYIVHAARPETKVARTHSVARTVRQKVSIPVSVPHPGRRTHWGWDAASVKVAFDALGMDFGGYVKAEDGTLHLRPDQLIPPLWKATQEMLAMIVALQAEVAALKAGKA